MRTPLFTNQTETLPPCCCYLRPKSENVKEKSPSNSLVRIGAFSLDLALLAQRARPRHYVAAFVASQMRAPRVMP
jgi:hypothetical protein